ncbi:SMa0974 family conjugal transfer regulator [Rhizobium rhizogenes]|uniref:SMa0974 family conjugal transfer regulator n=1 Tax=Rhizobium rhizogenes TaxID=359 RepID=UPI001572EFE5|nr:hypothetical protein [Rhizobium rhizogenes]NTF70060.1 hypothetical protein [Rhizobium rhizogenes]
MIDPISVILNEVPEISRNVNLKADGIDILKYIAETYVTLPNSDIWLEQICQQAAELCPSIISNGREKRFKCEEGHAIISATNIIADRACTPIRYGSRSAVTEGADRFLNFGDGCAIIRSTKDGLFVRISARDLVIFYGIRTLLEGSLLKLAAISNDAIEWFPAGRETPRPATDGTGASAQVSDVR